MFNLTTKPVSAGELMKKEKKPINFVVEKFISQGVHFLAGHPKSGKSWLSLWLALCVSNGNNLWGFKTNKSKVLYFCLEDTENRIQDRLEGMPGCDTENLLFMYDAPNMDNGFDVFLKKIVKEEPEIKLVIVDTFQLIRGEQFAGNAYACEYAEMNYLKRLAKELDITIILVHHLRKMHDSSPQNMISGSTALAGGADTTFVLYTFPKKKGYGILYCKGRDTDIREIELRFGFGTHIWEKISDSVEDSDGMKMVEIITKLLDESGPFSGTATELCKLIKEVCDVEFTAPILGKKLADNKEFLKDFKINYESVRDMYQRTQKLWFDPDRIKNDSAEENSDTESNSETEFDDKTAEVDEDNTTVNFETDAEADKEFIPFKMKIQM